MSVAATCRSRIFLVQQVAVAIILVANAFFLVTRFLVEFIFYKKMESSLS